MGTIPMRESSLQRPRTRKGADQQATRRGTMRPVEIPDPDVEWHPIARMFWDSLLDSGQKDFYQQSDWAFAYSLAEELSIYKTPRIARDGTEYHKRSPEMLKALQAGMTRLLVAEADRRQFRVELELPEQAVERSAELILIDTMRADLDGDEEDDEDDE